MWRRMRGGVEYEDLLVTEVTTPLTDDRSTATFTKLSDLQQFAVATVHHLAGAGDQPYRP